MQVPQRRMVHLAPLALATGVTVWLENWAEIPRWLK